MSEKKFLNETKTITPPLQVKWSVPKRKRSSNWDSSEITLLQQLVQENMSTLQSKLTNSVTNSRKISIWKNIAVQINLLGLHYRTDKEVKTKWQNMQTSAKKQYADRKKLQLKLAVDLRQKIEQ